MHQGMLHVVEPLYAGTPHPKTMGQCLQQLAEVPHQREGLLVLTTDACIGLVLRDEFVMVDRLQSEIWRLSSNKTCQLAM